MKQADHVDIALFVIPAKAGIPLPFPGQRKRDSSFCRDDFE
jgi:hypothetical protein